MHEKWKVKVKSLSRVRLYVTPWTAAFPSMGLSRQEYWSGVPRPSPNILVIICKPKIFLKAWHPDLCGFHWFLCVQIFWVEVSHCFKLVSSDIGYDMNERSHLKTNTRKFLQKMSDSKSPQAACTLSSNRFLSLPKETWKTWPPHFFASLFKLN